MNKLLPLILILLFFTETIRAQPNEKIQILLVGFDHLSQLDDGSPESNVFSAKKQTELKKLVSKLKQFSPDMIMVEAEPSEQPRLDSLFLLYKKGTIDLADIKYGTSETYQVGFRLAKQLNSKGVFGIDHYESTSQSLLSSGDHIEFFKEGLQKLINTARPLKKKVQQDSLSIYEYIKTMNKPELIELSHRALFNLPAYVTNGKFSESGTNTVDIGEIDEQYIGAEYITLFYNRNLKIYSNILNAQQRNNGKKLLVLLGQLHIGVLQNLLEDNPNYQLIDVMNYLN